MNTAGLSRVRTPVGTSGGAMRNVIFATLSVLLIAVVFIAFITYRADAAHANPLFASAAHYHTEIMAALVVLSLGFGFVTAQVWAKKMRRTQQDSRSILGVVLLFLSKEEREIVNFLVQHGGTTTQAEIARLPHLNRVRAHRGLQKMQDKQILDIIPHGKARRIVLKPHILALLR